MYNLFFNKQNLILCFIFIIFQIKITMIENKPINTIKIPNELMDILILKFFKVDEINRERDIMNAFKEYWWQSDIPHFSVSVKSKLDIPEKDIKKYFKKWNEFVKFNFMAKPPYFSLISDNSENDLQIFVNSWNDEEGVTCEDISCYSNYFLADYRKKKKYTFYNK